MEQHSSLGSGQWGTALGWGPGRSGPVVSGNVNAYRKLALWYALVRFCSSKSCKWYACDICRYTVLLAFILFCIVLCLNKWRLYEL